MSVQIAPVVKIGVVGDDVVGRWMDWKFRDLRQLSVLCPCQTKFRLLIYRFASPKKTGKSAIVGAICESPSYEGTFHAHLYVRTRISD